MLECILFGRVYLGLSGSLRIGVIKDWPHHPDVQSIIRDYSWFRIWQQIKKILNNNYDKSSINYFYFNQSDYLINKNRHFAFSPFCIFAISSAENRSSLLRKVFQPIRALFFERMVSFKLYTQKEQNFRNPDFMVMWWSTKMAICSIFKPPTDCMSSKRRNCIFEIRKFYIFWNKVWTSLMRAVWKPS